MTEKVISNKLAMMNGELDSLEQKIEQVLAMCTLLRDENRGLREQLVELDLRNQSLVARADGARQRLEALMDRLPAE